MSLTLHERAAIDLLSQIKGALFYDQVELQFIGTLELLAASDESSDADLTITESRLLWYMVSRYAELIEPLKTTRVLLPDDRRFGAGTYVCGYAEDLNTVLGLRERVATLRRLHAL